MARILIVDDEPTILMLIGMMLKREGYEVVEAKDGEECFSKLKEKKPDLILLDVMMPGQDGWEICRKIKGARETRGIPVAMFTVRTSEDSMEKSMEYGADAHINKPIDKKELFDTIKRLLGKASS